MKGLIGVFVLHLFCLVMLLLPDNIQGPVVYNASGVNFRTLDVTAILLIIAGSAYLFGHIFTQYKSQINNIKKQIDNDSSEKTQN